MSSKPLLSNMRSFMVAAMLLGMGAGLAVAPMDSYAKGSSSSRSSGSSRSSSGFGSFSSSKSSSTSSSYSAPKSVSAPPAEKSTSSSSFGSFGSSNKSPSSNTAAPNQTTQTAPTSKPAMSAMNSDLSSNAAKANAMKTYDAGKSNGNVSTAGSYGNAAASPTAQPAQTAPAPVVIYNNSGGSGGGGGLFGGGGSGPGFFSGLFVGNLLSSHRSEPNYRQNNSGDQGRYEGQMPGPGMQANANQATENSSFSFMKWLLILVAVGGAIAATVWFVRRKKSNSQPDVKRYKL